MPAKQSSRARRVAEQIKRTLASLVQTGLKDPRVSLLTINSVEVSRDFEHANIWFTSMKLDADHAEMVEVLNHSAGYLRKELGKGLTLRVTPQLHFHYDDSIENGAQISSLIEKALAEDREKDPDKDKDNKNSDSSDS